MSPVRNQSQRELAKALVTVRDELGVSNKVLFAELLTIIPQFMLDQRPDARTTKGKAQIKITNDLLKLSEEIREYMS